MLNFVDIFGILTGLALGISLAFFVTLIIVKKSNDIGDSQGELKDFGGNIQVLKWMDNLKAKDLS
ncbi:MAG: hypothetical protein IKP60_09825 [Treponema sp.]|nr:hypothetical protein [Treponema sp.]